MKNCYLHGQNSSAKLESWNRDLWFWSKLHFGDEPHVTVTVGICYFQVGNSAYHFGGQKKKSIFPFSVLQTRGVMYTSLESSALAGPVGNLSIFAISRDSPLGVVHPSHRH